MIATPERPESLRFLAPGAAMFEGHHYPDHFRAVLFERRADALRQQLRASPAPFIEEHASA